MQSGFVNRECRYNIFKRVSAIAMVGFESSVHALLSKMQRGLSYCRFHSFILDGSIGI